jgi:uncharacterized membrane protein HdeD (DUF308 family)
MDKINSKKDGLFNIVILILGVLIALVGILMSYTNISGTRWLEPIEGARLSGIIFILFGIYLIISSIKKLITHYRNK